MAFETGGSGANKDEDGRRVNGEKWGEIWRAKQAR